MKFKRILILMFSSIIFSSCSVNLGSSITSQEDSAIDAQIMAIYTQALEEGKTTLSYDDWIISIRGQDGHAPVITINADGYWCIDDVSTLVKAAGEKGEPGTDGKDGSSLLTGHGIPMNNLGKVDDSYIDLDTWNYYCKNINGWTLSGNIKGEKGTDGDSYIDCSHNFSEWEIVKNPSCTSIGIKVKKCTECGSLEYDCIEAKGHEVNKWSSMYKNCDDEIWYGVCTTCGETVFKTTESEGHSYDEPTYTWSDDFTTCTAKRICNNDTSHIETETSRASYKVIKESTYDETGIGRYTVSFTNPSFLTQTHDVDLEMLNKITYFLSDDKTYYSACASSRQISGTAIIDSTYNGLPVKHIYPNGFQSCSFLENVVIPDSVISIEEYAFAYCTSLKSVDISNSVEKICDSAFVDCRSLENIDLPSSIKTIERDAFGYCTSLKSIVIPNLVQSIERETFSCCSNLESITIEGDVTTIGLWAFANCESLSTINIPSSIKVVVEGAFDGCSALSFNEYSNGCYLGNESNLYLLLIKSKSNTITSCEINENCKIIYSYAFRSCTNLTSIIIPNEVFLISSLAFSGCSSLLSLTIGNGVLYIDEYAFNDCTSLASISIPNSVKTIGEKAFYNCKKATSLIIGSGVTSIGNYAFYSCQMLSTVDFASNSHVVSLGNEVFRYCTSLTSISIPNTVKTIGNYAFMSCTSLSSVVFTSSSRLLTIGCGAFMYCDKLQSVIIPNSVTSIEEDAFSNCTTLSSATIGKGVITIGYDAFESCRNLQTINYNGTTSEWKKIEKGSYWVDRVPASVVHCSNGDASL